jgi:hypothetical protein
MIAVGLLVIAAGTVPFTFYPYAPLGAGDRFNLVSSIGGALVWVGIAVALWRFRTVVLAVGVIVAALSGAARVQRIDHWTTAAADGRRITDAIQARFPSPPAGDVILGPSPVQQANIAAFLDQSNVTGMLRYLYRRSVPGGMAFRRADYERFPAPQRIDVWKLSRLDADVDLSTDNQGVPVTRGHRRVL